MEFNDICLICLRTDRKLKTAPALLSKYHNEMTNHYMKNIKRFNYCNFCELFLRKTYKFHQKCLTSAKILKKWLNSTASNKTPIGQIYLKLTPETLGPWTADNNKVYYFAEEDSLTVVQTNVRDSSLDPIKVPKLEIPSEVTPAVDRKVDECALEEINMVTNEDLQSDVDNIEIKEIKYTPDTHSIELINADIGNNENAQKTDTNSNLKVEETELEDDNIYLSDDDCNDNTIDEVEQLDYTSVDNDNEYIANNHTSDDDLEDNDDTITKVDKSKPIVQKIMSTLTTLNETLENVSQNWEIPVLNHMAEDIGIEDFRKITHEYLANKKNTASKIKNKNITFKMEAMVVDLSTIISESEVQVRDFNADLTRREWLVLTLGKNMRAWGEIYSEEGNLFDTESIITGLDRMPQKNIKQLYDYFSDTNNSRNLPLDITRILKNTEAKLKDEEYASVFDIQYLTTEKAKIEEFQQRKTYECYLKSKNRCDKCFVKFKNYGLLNFHNKTHHDESNTKHICSICSVRRSSKAGLTKHMNLHDEVFKCKLCPLVTYYRTSMIQHYLQHKGCQHVCEQCNKTFRTLTVLLTHNSQYHPRGVHICGICGGSYVSGTGLRNHITRKHPGATKDAESTELKCRVCDVTFPSIVDYSKHSRYYHRTFKGNVKRYVKGDVRRDVKCEHCSLSFRTKVECSRHLTSAHGIKRKKPVVRCRVCGEVGHSPGWVMLHYSMHHPTVDVAALYAGNKTHLCEICGKGFANICVLRDHMNNHEGITFPCPRCPKQFGTKRALKRHGLIHGPPGFTCKYCGKKFHSPSNLGNHLRFHIRDRRYKCEICDKGFLHRSTLTEHIRGVHRNVRRIRKPKLDTRRTRDTKEVTETVDEARETIDEVTEATDEVRETIDEVVDATDEFVESKDEIAETMEEIEIIHEETNVIEDDETKYELMETDEVLETKHRTNTCVVSDTEVEVNTALFNDMAEIGAEIVL